MVPIYLASASPRRLALLAELGFTVVPVPSGIEEDVHPGETPERRVLRLAEAKALHTAQQLRRQGNTAPAAVLGADTTVVLDDTTLEKPLDGEDAARMLRLLSGRTHRVCTGVFLCRLDDRVQTSGVVETTRVRFRRYDEATVRWYVGTGEPFDKAGAYGIQGLGVFLSAGIEGSWSNVVGLPLERVPELFRAVKLDLFGGGC